MKKGPLKRGETRDDGRRFWVYTKGYKNGERWVTEEFFQLWKKKEYETGKKRRENKKEEVNEYHKNWSKQNPEKVRIYRRKYKQKKRATDPAYLIRDRVRNLTTQAFRVRKYSKRSRTHELLGCDWDFLKNHIEKQFRDGMSWENRDKWHIDHIMPLATATSQEELEKLCHWTNLQPLWAIDNLKKKKKVPTEI